MAVSAHSRWLLLAPWYRWPQPGVAGSGRGTAPLLQKYAESRFVNDFLAEPQRSLKFQPEDYVHRVEPKVPVPSHSLSLLTRVRTELRKVFLDVHCRFYLVVVELCCDQPGLPAVKRDQICEAGFVVRRRVAPAQGEARKVLHAALAEVQQLESRLARLRGILPSGGSRRRTAPGVVIEALRDQCADEAEKLEGELTGKRAALAGLAASHGVAVEVQGWVSSGHPGVGSWQAVEETPTAETVELAEASFPLYPLIPDPANARHSAKGHTLWFGVLPTGGPDLDAAGNPRFDDRSLYEVRCYVRRHQAGCPRGKAPDCRGELVWSRPGESYRLAAPGDLDGTSHRPVTIVLPDLRDLQAQAAARPMGEGMGLRMIAPEGSSLEFQTNPDDVGNPGGATTGGPSICSFAIPLITIVATFVLKLFLPIVVFAFGLWWMLKLKFCILPSFEMDAGLAAELTAAGPGVEIGASLSVDITNTFKANLGAGPAGDLSTAYGGDITVLGHLAADLGADFHAQAPPEIAAELTPKAGYPAPRQPLPAITAGLEYYERVEVPA
jgi:hypothetical protein